ncbi:MAG: alpha/beta hydrolase [Cyclobacteriaceae bacterium]|nr:alpha/beta hydrolase [Cyclobacteriaceae bacterium]
MKPSSFISLIFTFSVLILFFQCTNSDSNKAQSIETAIPSEGYFMGADSLKLFYTIRGTGTDTLIMIHGGPGMDAGYMINDFDALEENHVLLFYDQRGGGHSDLPDTSHVEELLHIDRHVADLESLRQYFGLSKITLLAHSFGPAIAVNYAIEFPDKVDKMIFIGPIPPYKGEFFERYDESLTSRLSEKELSTMDSLGREMVEGENPQEACIAYWKIGLKPRISSELPIDVIKGDCCSSSSDAIRFGYGYTGNITFGSLGNWDYRPQLNNLHMPVLVIHGTEESIPMDMVKEWVKYLPNSKLDKIENAAHFPYAERPEIVWKSIEMFLEV